MPKFPKYREKKCLLIDAGFFVQCCQVCLFCSFIDFFHFSIFFSFSRLEITPIDHRSPTAQSPLTSKFLANKVQRQKGFRRTERMRIVHEILRIKNIKFQKFAQNLKVAKKIIKSPKK